MSLDKVYVLPTLDCEVAQNDMSEYAAEMSPSSPEDYEESEESMEGYRTVSEEYGFTPTFFAHEKVALNNSDYLRRVESEEGVCVGMHLHPYKLDDEYDKNIGGYAREEQKAIFERAIEIWEEGMGRKPKYFRAGQLSANDHTIPILLELGFEGGSMSRPGRNLTQPDRATQWVGAEPYAHRANLAFRQAIGESEFIQVPTSVDFSSKLTGSRDRYRNVFVPKPDFDYEQIVANIMDQMQEDEPPMPQMVIGGHNNEAYHDPENNEAGRHLIRIFEALDEYCEEHSIEQVDITLDEFIDQFRELDPEVTGSNPHAPEYP